MGGYSNQLIEDHIKCRRVDKVVYGFDRSNSWDEGGFVTVDKFALIPMNNRIVEMVSHPYKRVSTHVLLYDYIYILYINILSHMCRITYITYAE